MGFRSSKKASSKEAERKFREILSLLDDANSSIGDNSNPPEGEDVEERLREITSSLSALRDAMQIMGQRASDLVSRHERVFDEYKGFVESSQSKNDLPKGKRYQIASDFFSYVVSECGKQWQVAELLESDLLGCSEELDRIDQTVAETSATSAQKAPPSDSSAKNVKRLMDAVKELAGLLSIDIEKEIP
ncbi:hypothetical protein J7M28_11430 [bacterium]|nr:hypothetical protein [bacterium]